MYKIVLVRHGESIWNKENKFTGWTDVDLSKDGCKEAILVGKKLKKMGYSFDLAYTSVLKRAIKTLWNILSIMDLLWIPVIKNWELNERHYGALQGLNKDETAKKHGKNQVNLWRRSYDISPLPIEKFDHRYPGKEEKYLEIPEKKIPLTESLKDTVKRVVPFWEKNIVPNIKKNKKVIIVAHGNSLRALIKYIENINKKNIINLNIPTATPIIYELNEKLEIIKKDIINK
ncbi:MAG: 2,3-diphosphoglycerate-dependent phosphoglycerate mutase [Endomicrobium sp.]|jgi:2,3-bisphosphoglycerate-dependent phosphoglycerate mutase|nr:2,3-diphosphoglycerate-dependent phosphoglycerate mutase [Endomicrobium sp.]